MPSPIGISLRSFLLAVPGAGRLSGCARCVGASRDGHAAAPPQQRQSEGTAVRHNRTVSTNPQYPSIRRSPIGISLRSFLLAVPGAGRLSGCARCVGASRATSATCAMDMRLHHHNSDNQKARLYVTTGQFQQILNTHLIVGRCWFRGRSAHCD
jgi:hypothetical protein